MVSHGVFLQSMISVLHGLRSSLFPPPGYKAVLLSSHSLNSSAFCYAPLLFQTLIFKFLQGLTFWSNLVNMFALFFATVTVFLFLSSLHVFFPTSFTSAFVPLGQIPKKRLVMFSTFFRISFYDSPILL